MKQPCPLKDPHKVLLLCLLPFLAYGSLFLIKICYAEYAAPHLPPCLLRTLTGIRCPGCGMTHSVYALIRFDFIEAFRQNAAIPFLLLAALTQYAEMWLKVLHHPRRLLPRKKSFLYGCLIAWFLYCILRNIL